MRDNRNSGKGTRFMARRAAAIAADLLLLFFVVSVARTESLQIASRSVTQSEGTISRETVVTIEGVEGPPKPQSETKPELKPAKPDAQPEGQVRPELQAKPEPQVRPERAVKPEIQTKPEGQWSVQVRASQVQSESFGLAKRLKDKGYDAHVVEGQVQGQIWYRVRIGHFVTKQEAQALLNTLKSKEGLSGTFLVGP